MTTYPISLPPTPGFRQSSFRARNIVSDTASPFTGQQQVFKHAGEWWEATLQLPPMRGAKAAAWEAALISLQGKRGTFQLGDPDRTTPRGVATGTPVVDTVGSPTLNTARTRTLYTRGWDGGIAGIIKAADYLQIGTGEDARLVKAIADANSDSGGYAAIEIWPALYSDLADGTAITVINPKGVFRLTDDIEWSTDAAKTYGFTFSARSVI